MRNLTVLVISSVLFVMLSSAVAMAATTISVSPSHTDVNNGDTFSIDVAVDTNDDLYAMDFELSYDPSKVTVYRADEGAFLQQGGTNTYVAINDTDNGAGKYSFAVTRLESQTGANGQGTILTLNFNTVSHGTSTLDLSSVDVADVGINAVSATVNDGDVRVNRVPSASNVQLTPASPVTTDDLETSYVYSDPDSDAESGSEIKWYKNSVHQAAYDDLPTLLSSATAKGEQWYFTVRPSDGFGFGTIQTSNTVTIGNTAPTIPTANVLTDPVYVGSTLTATASGATDADGDALTYYYEFYNVNDAGTLQAYSTDNTYVVQVSDAHDTIDVRAKAWDGTEFGPELEQSRGVSNTAPVTPTDLAADDNKKVGQDISASCTSSDVDGDSVTISYEFYNVDDAGTVQAYSTDNTYTVAVGDAHDQIMVRCKANDGTADSGEDEVTVNVANTAPTAPVISVTPASPTTDDDLTCNIDTASTDADTDTVTYSYAWYQDTVLQGDLTTDTVPSSRTAKGENWQCVVTPNDGYDDGPTAQDQVTVGNTVPVASGLDLSPASPQTGDDLVSSYTYFDKDGDSESGSEIRWYKNSVLQAAYDDLSIIPSSATAKGEQWYFTVRPSDGFGFGTIQTSNTVTIGNTAPVIDSYSPSNTLVAFRDGLSINFGHESSDVDSDTITYSWKLNGTEMATSHDWSNTFGTCGMSEVEITIFDGDNGYDSQPWLVSTRLSGDVDLDGDVDIFDLARVGLAFNTNTGEANWNPDADIATLPGSDGTPEGDGTINIMDLATVGQNYGRTC